MRLVAWEKIKVQELKRSAGNLWESYASSPLDLKVIDFDQLEEMFAQPEKKAKNLTEKKEEKKKGPTYISLIDGKKSLGINLITKNLRMYVGYYDILPCILQASF